MSDRRLIYVLNPVAGGGKYLKDAVAEARDAGAAETHLTEKPGDCAAFIAGACLKDPYTRFVVFGGDGTAGEAAQGILSAGAGETAVLTVVPAGSGNDFVHGAAETLTLPDGEDSVPVDVLSVNGKTVLNMLNIGWDCAIAARSEPLRRKKFITNGLSYVLALLAELPHRDPIPMTIRLTTDAGEEVVEGEFLLTAFGCFPYCGGGFKALAAADPTDGLMDVAIARNIPTKLLPKILDYKSGVYLNRETLSVYPPLDEYISYRRARAAVVSGFRRCCMDGEIAEAAGARITVLPKAIRIAPRKK